MSQVTLKAANRDLHSGLYGGSALNPINALARILGDLHDANGRIQLPGFYDKVKPVSNAQRAQWDALGFDERAFLGKIGLETPAGERGYSALERLWARPTADINGMWGGYTGAGQQDGDRIRGIGQDLVPPGAGPGSGRGVRTVQALRRRTPAAWRHGRDRRRHAHARHRGEHGKPLGPRRAGGARRGVRQAGGADRQRRLDPGGDVAAPACSASTAC